MKIGNGMAPWKIWTAVGIGILLLADLALCVVLWQASREAPEDMAMQRDHLADTARKLEADVTRGEKIRAEMGQVGQSSQSFYQSTFLDEKTLYSTVDSDIASIASKSGVKTTGYQFKPSVVPNRNVTELDITMTVNGDYPSLLQFVSGIERSKNFYFLKQLQLNEAGPQGIRLQLDLHTYYRG
jgi:Tfp pilus assembly protein PilO